MIKRGDDIPGLKLSGPQSSNLFKFADKTAECLDERNAWTHCVNELNPTAPAALRIPRITWFVFKRFKRDFILWHDDETWVLDTLAAWLDRRARIRFAQMIGELAKAVAEGVARARAEAKRNRKGDGDPPNAAAGSGPTKPGPTHKPGQGPQANPPPAHDSEGDAFQPISAAPRRTRPAGEPQSWRAAMLWRVRKIVRRAPRFRHMRFLVEEAATLAKAAVRRFADQAQNALARSLHALNLLVSDAEQIVQQQSPGALFEPQVVERAGLRLTVWTFSAYPRPEWERWLFGRLIEDEQLAV